MANVTGASLSPILNRLNAVDNYHPMNADTFADWATEAGDIVAVTRDGRTYNAPVHSMTMTWRGTTPQTSINATGKQKRDPVSTISNRKFRGGKSAIRKTGKQYKYEVNQDHLMYEIFDTEGRFSRLEVTEMGLFHEVYDTDGAMSRLQNTARGLFHEVYDADGRVSVLENTADGLYHEVYDPGTGLNAKLQSQAGRIGMVVGTGSDGNYIKAGEIALAINDAGESEALIDANKIRLTGNTTVGGMLSVSGGIVSFNGNVQAGLTGGNYIRGTQLRIVGASSSQGVSELTVNYTSLASTIKDASVSNNTLTLTRYDGTTVTFNKSVTLTPAWGGPDGRTGKTYTVTATQNNVSVGSVGIELADGEWAKTYEPGVAGSWSGNIFTGNIVQKVSAGHYGTTGLTYSVNAVERYNAGATVGYNNGRPVSGTAGGRTSGVSALVHDFTITKGDGTTATLQINCSSIYATARQGYTAGTFTLASVTLQGDSQSVYIVPSSGGTNYYQAGTAKTYYNAGSSATYYNAGSSVTYYTRNTTALTLKRYSTGEVTLYVAPTGGAQGIKHDWYYVDNNGTKYYTSTGSATVTKQGSSVTVTKQGSSVSVTPISGSALKLTATTRFAAGTTVTDRYYTKS